MKVAGTRTLAGTGDRPRPVRACVLDFRLAGAKSLYGQCLLVTAILNSFCEDMLTKSMALSTFESAQGLIMSERYKWWFLCSLVSKFSHENEQTVCIRSARKAGESAPERQR